MGLAFLFPGQGSQAVGMARSLAEASRAAAEALEEVDDALGRHLRRLMFDGPEDQLTLTANAQPAIMAASLATVAALERDAGFLLAARGSHVAGHSLGEYSALAAAGALTLADTARLLATRGEAMQAAVPEGEGAMAAILGLDFDAIAAIAAASEQAPDGRREVCAAANDNAPGQVVVSGHRTAVDRAIARARAAGARRAMPLAVSAPFHCELMEPAARIMETALARVSLQTPRLPLIANMTAAPATAPDELRALLVQQVTGMVRWRESVLAMEAAGVHTMIELGGKVLGPMVKRIAPDIRTLSVMTPDDVDTLVAIL